MSTVDLTGTRVAVVNWRDRDHRLAGGAERYAWELARGLREAGAEVEFVTSRDEGQSPSARVEDIEVIRRGGALTYFLWAALHLLRGRRRLDLVVDASTGVPTFAPLWVGSRTPVVLVMHHVHLDQFGVHLPAPLAWWGRFLERRVMPLVYRRRRTVAVSQSTRDEMRTRLGWTGEIDLLPNGADAPAEGLALAGASPRRLLMLGRLVAHKRCDLVLRALALLDDELSDVSLDVVGRGPERPALEDLARDLGIADRVRFHGYVDDSGKAALLHRAGLHVCASDAEGWGQVVVEAAAYGVPTVARRVPGLRDSIVDGRTGWLVPEDGTGTSPAVLAAAIRGAVGQLELPGRATELERHCTAWAGSFSWRAMRRDGARLVAEELGRAERECVTVEPAVVLGRSESSSSEVSVG